MFVVIVAFIDKTITPLVNHTQLTDVTTTDVSIFSTFSVCFPSIKMSEISKNEADDPIKKRINKTLESRLDTDKVQANTKSNNRKTN